jgi:4a-hydroxytetrahydrobiopterin dehydratase
MLAAITARVNRRVLSDAELGDALEQLDWNREGDELVKTVTLANFADALAWVNRVGAIAENLDHHPDITIRWNTVSLRVTTHSAGALTEADVELAKAVDGLG